MKINLKKAQKENTVRISQGMTGRYYWTPEECSYLDESGAGLDTVIGAARAANRCNAEYTHYIHNGKVRKIS